MKKTLISTCIVFIALALFSSTAFSWGPATHAYIADNIGKKWGLKNINEIYGAMAPDTFNYMFGSPYQQYLRNLTHGIPDIQSPVESFLKVWNKGRGGLKKSLAYGFVSHNDVWGVDSTAHWDAQTFYPPTGSEFPLPEGFPPDESPLPPGYSIIKAWELDSLYTNVWKALGIEGDAFYLLRIELCHVVVEAAGDILIKEQDPWIGLKVISSALFRSGSFPFLLARAYAGDLVDYSKLLSPGLELKRSQAAGFIISAEKEFREMMIRLGLVLMQDKDTAIEMAAEYMVDLVVAYLASLGFEIDPEILPVLVVNAKNALLLAMDIISVDYMQEVNATKGFVEDNLEFLPY